MTITNCGYYRKNKSTIAPIECTFTFSCNSYKQNNVTIRPLIGVTVDKDDHTIAFKFWTCAYDVRVKMYDHETGEKIKTNTTVMFSDMDGNQYFGFKANEGSMNLHTLSTSDMWAKKAGGRTWIYAPGNGDTKDFYQYTAGGAAATLKKSGDFSVYIGPNNDFSGSSGFANIGPSGPWSYNVSGKEAFKRMSTVAKGLENIFAKPRKGERYYNNAVDGMSAVAATAGFGTCYLRLESSFFGTTMPEITKKAHYTGTDTVIPGGKLTYTERKFRYSLYVNLP